MKKISYLLLFVFLTTSLMPYRDSSEWVKLSFLLKHFQAHQVENAHTTFFEFIYIHYINPQQHQNTSHEHEKLPFQAHHSHVGCHQLNFFVENYFEFDFKGFVFISNIQADYYQANHYFNYHNAIFQPPKPSFV